MKGKEIRGFQSEVKQLLNLMIHSLYSNKEIFLRELISNASDAVDKLRFYALSDSKLYDNDSNLHVRVSINNEQKSITFSDNGIGMTRQEVIDNLGTIAKSGTKTFLESIGQDKEKDNKLIGQFGVGFYSAFIVASKVSVLTRSIKSDVNNAVLWESSGEGEYTINDAYKENRGTDITLYLRDEEKEFLNINNLRNIINKYSDHISLPIEIEKKTEDNKEKSDSITWEQINNAKALWTRNKSEISKIEYHDFYKYITHDSKDPLIWSHNHVEGKQDYISLLYVPSHASWDIWNREHLLGLKLYVQKVFIMDDAKQFVPNYLRFVKGIIDSNDLPLNVSREILQDNKITQNLRSALIKRTLQMLSTLSKDVEKYQIFWKAFGLVLKEGPAEDHVNQQEIAKLLRFSSTYTNNEQQTVSLTDYISRMNDKQDKIYYITADSYISAKDSPHLEIFKSKNIEVLLLSDRVDEWMMNYLIQFNDKNFQSITKSDDSLNKLIDNQNNEQQKEKEKELTPFLTRVQTLLKDKVKSVKLTYRITDTPAIVTTDINEMSTQMAKLFASAGQKAPEVKYNFEINPDHELVKYIINTEDDNKFEEWIILLLNQALLAEKGTLENPNYFIRCINKLFLENIKI